MLLEVVEKLFWLNVVVYMFSAVSLIVFKDKISVLHGKLFGISDLEKLRMSYFNILGIYKILVIVFAVLPYVAIRCIGN